MYQKYFSVWFLSLISNSTNTDAWPDQLLDK